MSDPTTQPISPTRFAQALESLPLDALHAKAAEIQNSIAHLRSSNEQMLPFADEGDEVCREAMFENLTVIGRMNERVALLREEVEKRGYLWGEDAEDGERGAGLKEGAMVNGGRDGGVGVVGGDGDAIVVGNEERRQEGGRLTDEELRARMEARMMADQSEENEDGVHL